MLESPKCLLALICGLIRAYEMYVSSEGSDDPLLLALYDNHQKSCVLAQLLICPSGQKD